MNIIILGGFLGSGKTTVLLQLAETIVKKYSEQYATPIVIIENEIGEVNVDGKILSSYEVRELFSGCICCTMAGDLTSSIKEIHKEFSPKFIIVEATGLAQPQSIVDTILRYAPECERVKVIAIADASRWYEMIDYMDIFVTKQMQSGDIILLNKCDLVDEKTKNNILASLKDINGKAQAVALSATEGIGKITKLIMEECDE